MIFNNYKELLSFYFFFGVLIKICKHMKFNRLFGFYKNYDYYCKKI